MSHRTCCIPMHSITQPHRRQEIGYSQRGMPGALRFPAALPRLPDLLQTRGACGAQAPQGQNELSRDQTRTLVEGSGVPTPHPRRPRVPTGPLTIAPADRSSDINPEDPCAPEPIALFSGGTFRRRPLRAWTCRFVLWRNLARGFAKAKLTAPEGLPGRSPTPVLTGPCAA